MRTTVTVIGKSAAARTDATIDAPGGTAMALVLERLTELAGLPPGASMSIDNLTVNPLTPLSESGLREGSIVAAAGPRPTAQLAGYLELRVLGGPAAGHSHPLRSGTTTLGRGVARGIALEDPDVSRKHLSLGVTADGVDVADAGSTNGSRLDGAALDSAPRRLVPGMRLRVGNSTLGLGLAEDAPVALSVTSDNRLSYNRSPRLDAPDPRRPRRSVDFPAPPADRPAARLPVIATVAPLLMGVALAAVMRRPEYLLFTVLSPVMMAGQWLSDRVGHGKQTRAGSAAYAAKLLAAQEELAVAIADEQAERRHRSPDAATLLAIARAPSTRLWERRRADVDFLQVRLGSGSAPAWLRIEGEAPVAAARVDDVPITVRLADAGVLGLAGDAARVRAVTRFVVGQLAALHSPRELGLVVLAAASLADSWDWLRWLPHLRPPTPGSCEALVGLDAETVAARVGELTALVASRLQSASTHAGPHRAVVVIVDGARALRHTPGLAQLLSAGPAVGVYAICLDTDESSLPEECGAVAISAGSRDTSLRLRVTGQLDVDELIADGVDIAWAERISRALAPLRDDTPSDGDSLPDAIRWTDLAQIDRDGLSAQLAAQWTRPANQPGGTTNVVIGRSADGPVFVDIARDGPHALIAGTTGSGKSDLLQTLVVALACANRPDEVSFVLVDYKGGAAFGACATLPHTVGLVTDLDGGLVERALVSLSAELRRRESLLATVGAAHIDDYRRTGARLARLVIVVDEFASLADELPDFVNGLVGVAQRGRSLGVHLVLATQRPEGVVSADIRANTNMRICLAVARAAESRDVIDTPDAAHISRTTPGRGYLRTGHGELRAFQTGRVGGVAAAVVRDRIDVTPSPFRALGHPRVAAEDAKRVGTVALPAATDLDVLVASCRVAAGELSIDSSASPWLAPLPAIVDTSTERATPLVAFIGIQDVPARQARQPLLFDLAVRGHLLIAGSPRSGRTTLLRTFAGSVAQRTPLRDLHLYAFDCAGGGLAALDTLPHCGGVVGVHETDRAKRLVSILLTELVLRQTCLATGGFGSITEQRAGSDDPLPHLVIAIDGWESFVSCYEDVDGGSILEGSYRLLREGAGVGIHLVIAADRAGLVGRLASTIENRLVLRLADRSDFSLIGLPPRTVPTTLPAGRGYWVEGLLETQIALLSAEGGGPAQLAALALIADDARIREGDALDERGPRRVDAVPTRIAWTQLASGRDTAAARGSALVTLGIGGDELRPITADLLELGPGFVISGPPRSGRSTALATIAANLQSTGWRVVAITPRRSQVADFADHCFDPTDTGLGAAVFDQVDDGRSLAIVVDDAELVLDSTAASILDRFARQARDAGELLVVAGTTEDLSVGFRGFVVDARRSRSGLLLNPRGPLDGELLGVRLPRTTGSAAPAGRGLAVSRGGLTAIQVALPA